MLGRLTAVQVFESLTRRMAKPDMKRFVGCFLLAFIGACSPDKQNADSSWPTFGHDVSNSKYSALTHIDTSNVSRLQEAWRFKTTQKEVGFTSIL